MFLPRRGCEMAPCLASLRGDSWAHIAAFLILGPLEESHDKRQNRRSLKIAAPSSSLLWRCSVSPAAFPQPGPPGGEASRGASGGRRGAVGRARLPGSGVSLSAAQPQRGQEKGLPALLQL